MRYNHFPEEIRQIIKEPFVFISYCHKNKTTYEKVKGLASYLKKNDIPIIYDNGGLAPGEEVVQFENLILHENCRFVLIVCDDEYIYKAQQNEGGVWDEFFLISNNYLRDVRKYIPLKRAENILPIFAGKTYIDFSDENENAFNAVLRSLDSVKKKTKNQITSKQQHVEKLYVKADEAYIKKNYKTAKKNIEKAINLCSQKNKKWLLRCINLELCIDIKMKDKKNATATANKLIEVLTPRTDPFLRIKYYANCALAYRLNEEKMEEYEKYALSAYQLAQKYGDEDMDYYACMYATALYETDQFSAAYKAIKEAYRLFIDHHKCNLEYSLEERDLLIKIKGNIAEIAIACSENLQLDRRKKFVYLKEAQEIILEILSDSNMEYDDNIQLEIYGVAERVFCALKKYYFTEIG